MSKITNGGLTRSGTGCFIAVPITTTVGVKGLTIRAAVMWKNGWKRSTSVKRWRNLYSVRILSPQVDRSGRLCGPKTVENVNAYDYTANETRSAKRFGILQLQSALIRSVRDHCENQTTNQLLVSLRAWPCGGWVGVGLCIYTLEH